MDFDPGPPAAFAQHFANLPSYAGKRDCFWYDWGPIFYRGRLDGSAKFLGIASDPGPTERIAARTLVGDAGQRVQGFLTKLGLTHSYVLVNAYAFALLPTKAPEARPLLAEPEHKAWRNKLYDDITGSALQAIVAFGSEAQRALHLWDSKPDVPTFEVPHPSSHNTPALLHEWRTVIPQLREIVDPDPGGDASGPNYGTSHFEERDYARIPPADLPFGMPAWFGDDAWGRSAHPQHNNSVERPGSDLRHKLIWQAPKDQP
jgi:Uracil DNA glycosylase superfamily